MNIVEDINDRLKGIATSDIPSSSNAYTPPLPKDQPEWSLIEAAEVPQAPSRSSYTAKESELFVWILNNPSEKSRYSAGARSTIDWEKFAQRWTHWCKVETARGCPFGSYRLRTKDQLKQKKKDNAASSKSRKV